MVDSFLRTLSRIRINYLNNLNPIESQIRILKKIINQGSGCKFFKDHNLNPRMSVEEYQQAVPLRTYENFWDEYMKSDFPVVTNKIWPGTINNYSWTSGTTTGSRKYIPYNSNIKLNYTLAGIDLLAFHYLNKPNSKLFSGKTLILTAAEKFEEPSPKIFVGEVSGFSTKNLPFFLKPFKYPPSTIASIPDWDKRVGEIVKNLSGQKITGIAGMPSWLIVFFERLGLSVDNQKGFLTRRFPDLQILIHGGVNFLPYYDRFKEICDGLDLDFREVYPSSEGFIAVGDQAFGEGLRLLFNHGIFFEFVPFEELNSKAPVRHWLKNVELDVNYALVLTNGAGFWSYILGDTVRFVSLNPPRIMITGRTKFSLSAFGEHLIGEELEIAVFEAAKQLNTHVVDFCVGAEFLNQQNAYGRHHFFIETTTSVDPLELATLIDSKLKQLNDDYNDHRKENCGLEAPAVTLVPKGFFVAWMKDKGKLGDQYKVPRVLNEELMKEIRKILASRLE